MENEDARDEIGDMVLALRDAFPSIDAEALEAALMLERAHSTLADMRIAYWSRFGLTPLRFGLLRLLYLAPGNRLNMSDIAAGLNATHSSITQLIDAVIRDGLVGREASSDDKRVTYAVLTDEGRTLFATVFPQNAARVSRVWAGLDDEEKRQMGRLLKKLRRHAIHYALD